VWHRSRNEDLAFAAGVPNVNPEPALNDPEQPQPRGIKRLLILEDEPFYSRQLERLLRDSLGPDFAFYVIRTLAAAKSSLDEGHFDAALCDLNLPDSTGIDTLVSLMQAAPGLPVVVLTGVEDASLGMVALRSGAQDFIQKDDIDGARLGDALLFAIERKKKEIEISMTALRLAYLDDLTGLPTRGLLNTQWARTVARSKRHGTGVGLVMVDLDNFKRINDSAGHSAGDDVLREVTRRLQETVRGSDQIFRIGGDEFLMVFEGVANDEQLSTTVEKLRAVFDHPVRIGEDQMTIGASFGPVHVGPDDLSDEALKTLFERADTAMYAEKRRHHSL